MKWFKAHKVVDDGKVVRTLIKVAQDYVEAMYKGEELEVYVEELVEVLRMTYKLLKGNMISNSAAEESKVRAMLERYEALGRDSNVLEE